MIFLQLFYEFFKIGLFAVGGGMATIPFLMDLTSRYSWFTMADLTKYDRRQRKHSRIDPASIWRLTPDLMPPESPALSARRSALFYRHGSSLS